MPLKFWSKDYIYNVDILLTMFTFLQRTSHFALADGTSFLMFFFCIERQKVQSVQSVQLFTICK